MLGTYFVYTITLVLPVFLFFVGNYFNVYKKAFEILGFVWLLFIASIRYGVGTDYFNYVNNYDLINLYSDSSAYKEFGFVFLNKLIYALGLNVQWLFVIMSFLTLFFIYISIPSKYRGLFVLLYVTSLYFMSYVLVRQAFAVSISGCLIKYANEKRPLKYYFLTLLGALFHLSMLSFVPIYFLRKIKINSFVLVMSFLGFAFVTFYTNIIGTLFKYVFSFTPYSGYFLEEYFIAKPEIGSGLGMLVILVIGLMIFIFRDRIVEKYPDLNFPINVSFVFFCIYVLSLQLVILGRLKDVFIFYYIYPIPFMLEVLPIKPKYIPKLFVLVVFIVLYYYTISISDSSLGTGAGISPYKTIFCL